MKYTKVIKIFIFVFVFAGIAITITTFTQQAQQDDVPTPIKLGEITEKQKKHSKIFSETKRNKTLISEQGDVEIRISVHLGRIPGETQPSDRSEYLQRLSCTADSVVIAKIKNKTSQLTENLEFVFTDYELDIREVLKNNSGLDISASKTATLTDAGGSVKVGDRTIKVILERDTPLLVNREYLLFLKYLSDSESYRLIGERGIFAVSDNKLKFPSNLYPNNKDNTKDFLTLIRSGVSNCPTEGGQRK